MMKEFDKILQTINVLITSWGTFLTSMFQNVMDAHKLKENGEKAVRHKGACHTEKLNILCKIILEDVEHPIPETYINMKVLCSADIKYLKELVEDNVFDESEAQLIAHNMYEALKEKILSL